MDSVSAPRRPLKTRQSRWAPAVARALVRAGLLPNHVSVVSVAFAASGAASLVWSARLRGGVAALLLLSAAAAIQLRLLCNLLDGLMAVEGGLKTKTGELYNDVPDRLADPLLLAAAGYAVPDASGVALGWLAALLALLTAYVRVLGGSVGLPQSFIGPMAKQHRMAVLTLGCALAAAEIWMGWPRMALEWALIVIIAGSAVTFVRRLRRIAKEMQAR